jgi:hypothetical protein
VKSRLAVPRSTATRAPFHALVHEMKKAAHVGDHRRGGRGLDDCAVVLVGRYGCRNRQAARGPRRPWVNSPWCCLGSSPPTRERQGAKECRKPESWWQNHEIGGGFPLMAPRKRIQGALVDGRRSASRMSLLFDEGAAEPALVPRLPLGYQSVEARQRASEVGLQTGTRLTTPWPGSSAHAVLCSSLREAGGGRHDRSWRRVVNRAST